MFLRVFVFACCLLASQLGFAKPNAVPPEKASYIGDWQGQQMHLHIFQNGEIKYRRNEPGKNVDMNIELVRFNGDNFDAGANMGFATVSATFVVSKPPHREGDKWKMTVDGVELTRVD